MYPHIILKSKISSIREVARVIRYMHVASFPRVMFGPLHYRKIKKEKSQALKQCKVDYEAKMTVTTCAKSELQWWINHVHTAFNVINRNSPEITVFTDASNIGWSGVTECEDRAGDNWQEIIGPPLKLKAISIFLNYWQFPTH